MCSENCVKMYKKLLAGKALLIVVLGVVFAAAGVWFHCVNAKAMESSTDVVKQVPEVEHPMAEPKMYSKTMRCPNCGMMINMWARTRHTFHHPEGDLTTCSIRCMADKAVSSGAEPSQGKVAVYLDPDTMIPVNEATYVIGSTAPGTMTMKSKIAFADREAAEKFAASYGGEIVDFQGAYSAAKMELPKSRMLIDKKRKKTGKIKEPAAEDTCVVCGMYPAKFPAHHSQIWARNGETLHFCSTKCMVSFNADPAKYVKDFSGTQMAWVTLKSDGMYESAFGTYYVVGSMVDGPMGKEAIPFKFKNNAEDFVKNNGGKIVSFSELTPQLVSDGE